MATHVIVIGGGISGLTAAREVESLAPDAEVTLLESSARLGGIIRTEREGDYVIDPGPDNFVVSKPYGAQLCRALGLTNELIETNEDSRRVMMVKDDTLVPIPGGMFLAVPGRLTDFLRSPLVSLRGRVRVVMEYLLPRFFNLPVLSAWFAGERTPKRDQDESIGAFIGRRLGREMVDMFAGPLMAGIYAGDPYTLSMRSTFPQLIALEREHGGLIRGVRAMMAARGSLQKRGTPHSPFLSLRGGMGTLIETLRAKLTRTTVRLNTSVTAVSSDERHLRANASRTHAGKQFRVTLADGSALEADAVIVCTPPRVTAGLIAGLDKTASIWMESIESATTASVFLAWSREHVRALPAASGLLVPRSASRAMSAATLINNKWPGRAPDDQVFLRVFFGGVRDPLVDSLDDAQLVRLAVKEVGPLLGVAPDAPLRFHRVYRWVACNPQPDLGHADNMAQVAYFMDKIGPIAISAGGVRGIGIPDCVNHAQQAARSVITALNARTRSSSPRPTA